MADSEPLHDGQIRNPNREAGVKNSWCCRGTPAPQYRTQVNQNLLPRCWIGVAAAVSGSFHRRGQDRPWSAVGLIVEWAMLSDWRPIQRHRDADSDDVPRKALPATFTRL
jgi:hypothetical protein